MPVYSNDDGTSKSVWAIACNAAASFLLAAGTLTADRTLTCPDASGIISIRDDFSTNYNKLDPASTPTFSNVTLANPLPVGSGGTGQSTYTNGQILIGNTTGNTLTKATITQASANQVIVTNGAGSITLSLPQSIATSSTVQFASVGIGTAGGTYPLNVQSTGANAPAINVARAGTGNGNGQWWGFGIDNSAGTDAVFFACASSNYTTGGGSAWVQNSSAYLGYPASGPMLIGPTGGTTYPVLNLATTRFVGINVATPLKPLHLSVSGQCDMLFNETSQGTDLKNWALSNRSQTFVIGTQNDAGNSFSAKISIDRSGNTTWIDAANIIVGSTTGTKVGTAITQKLGFYNATPIVQRSGASQVAVVTTAATNVTPYGYTQSQADSIVTLVNELRAWAVAQGFIKGSA